MALKKPNKKKVDEVGEGYEGMDEDDLEDDDFEENAPKKSRVRKVKKRFVAFAQQSRAGVVDNETGEVVGEGEFGVYEILATMLERLERMEATIGSLIE